MATPPTRDEHLAWCKERALAFADNGDVALTIASLASDLSKHDDTAGHNAPELMTRLAMGGHFRRPGELREFVEGIQ